MNIQQIAKQLLEAERTKAPIAPLTHTYKEITPQQAYQIQLAQIEEKVQNGAAVKGLKIGLTSKAMQDMLNVHTPDYGFVLDTMLFEEGAPIKAESFLQPKVEFEIAFVFKKAIVGADVTVEEVIDAIDFVVPAVEIIDSRIEDWKIRFEDTVADNGSSAGAILGSRKTALSEIPDIAAIPMTVYKNGEWLDEATSAAVLGNPLNAVVWLAQALDEYGISIEPGMFVLSGALSKAVPFEAGDRFEADFDVLGKVSMNFAKEVMMK
ncbi:2-keto-4-pentenoate hydratase [Planococcus glaciei]|uniref:2-keto-4-pentenoate hydratase n=1 Tax=Planococcus glaciei TaxID=459472 RepID=UPI00088F83E5|nr:2-keto-4-pentenoate hydratase [Planococcus glaciei]SDG74011.1 2-keto-4-pentenoate hydratase [Planococcus glaciei]